MKRFSKIISIILAITILLAIPISAQASTKMKSPYRSGTFTISKSQSGKTVLHGIDVSEHNGDINWKTVKSKIDFAIIRVGYRGYGKSGDLLKDKKFDENIKAAKENGVPVGIYFYSQATTTKEAKEEANLTIKWLGKYELEYPIFYDYEFASVRSGRLDSAWNNGKLNQEKMTNNALAFMKAIRSTGKDAMIYASRCFLEDNVDHKVITENGFGIWVAEYDYSTEFKGKYAGWQYSSVGKVDGIKGNIDCNFWFADKEDNSPKFSADAIKDTYYNGERKSPTPKVYAGNTELILGTDYELQYENNKNVGTASVTITGIGEYENYKSKTLYFRILPKTVTNLAITKVGINSLSLTWDKDDYAAEYDIQVYRSGKWKDYTTTKENKINITGLKSATIYNVRIRARKSTSGIYYNGKYCTAVKGTTIPDKMTKVDAIPSEKSVKLIWKKLDNATGYQLQKYDYSSEKYYLLADTKNGSFTDTNLKPNTIQRYRIRAYKKDPNGKLIYGKYSSKTIVYTNSTPTIKKATSPKSQRIKVSWKKTNGVTGYQVQWSTYKDFSYNQKIVFVKGADKSSTTLKTAQSRKQYYVRIRSYKTRNGTRQYSPWSETLPVYVK